MSEQPVPRLVGASVLRTEDPRFLTGRGRYLADIQLPRMLEAAFVRSPHAHARVRSIEPPAGARIVTWSDMADRVEPLVARSNFSSYRETAYHPLAAGVVRFAGQPVALVAARDRHAAEALAEQVDVDYELLPAVVDAEAALAPGAPQLHEEAPGNLLIERAYGKREEVEAAAAGAAVVVRRRFRHGRLVGVPIEGRGCIADWDGAAGTLRVWSATQVPHLLRTYLAGFLHLPEQRIQVVAPDVGGGFGIKSTIYPEEVAIAFAAVHLGRPVKWVEDRLEHMLASIHSREQAHDAMLAVDGEGRIVALSDVLVSDNGAYAAFPWTAAMEPMMAIGLLPGPYSVPVYHAVGRGVATNKSPHAPYRGVARPATSFVVESLLDLAARELGMDPVEIRRRNLIREFPHRSPTGVVHDRASYLEALDELVRLVDYPGLLRERDRLRAEGRRVGVGVSCFAELTGIGSGTAVAPGVEHRYGNESAEVRMDPHGGVTIAVGVLSHGQGLETTLAQVAADELGLPLEAIRVVQGDTAATPFGQGSYASRSAVLAGGAVMAATADLRRKLVAIAAHLLEAAEEDVQLRDATLQVRGVPDRRLSIAQVAELAHFRADLLPPGMDPGLQVGRFFDSRFGTFANAAHLAMVEVDPRTGAVGILRFVVVDDCGVMINPMIVDGQIRGAVAQGIGEALYEELRYDESGQLQTASLMDYLVPTATEIPDLEIHHLVTPSDKPGGFKGVGEGGTVGAPAAIASAVRDALGGTGEDVTELPIRPETLWRACQAARSSARTAISAASSRR